MKRVLAALRISLLTLSHLFALAIMLRLIVLANDADWDQYFTGAAVDWIAWTTEHRPPLWSYPFCGGVTRIGDPQAFGVSPLFALVLLLGPLWGTKAIQVLLVVAGYLLSRRLVRTVLESGGRPLASNIRGEIASSMALILTTSSYLLWRTVIGHYTAYPMYLLIGLIAYSLRALAGPLTRTEWVGAILLGWVYYTTGFYFSLVFLWMPFALAMVIALALGLLVRLTARHDASDLLGAFRRVAVLNVACILPGLYKIVPVVLHHLHYPRGTGEAWDNQSKLLNFVLFQFLPTRGSQLLVADGSADYYYSIFEIAGFSPISWTFIAVLLAALIGFLWRRTGWGRMRRRGAGEPPVRDLHARPLPLVLIVYGILSVLLCLGKFVRWAPFPLINHGLFHDSIVITERFNFSVTLSWALIVLWLAASRPALRRWMQVWLWLGMGVNCLVLWWFAQTFTPWSQVDLLRRFMDASRAVPTERMTSLIVGKPIGFIPMYATLMRGEGFLNCYNHMNRPVAMSEIIVETEKKLSDGDPRFTWETFPLVGDRGTPPPRSCVEGSYFTSSRLHLDSSCPLGVCLNINAVNPSDPLRAHLATAGGLFCLAQ